MDNAETTGQRRFLEQWRKPIDIGTVMDEHDVFTSAMGFIFDLDAVKSDSVQFVHNLPLRKVVHKVRHAIRRSQKIGTIDAFRYCTEMPPP